VLTQLDQKPQHVKGLVHSSLLACIFYLCIYMLLCAGVNEEFPDGNISELNKYLKEHNKQYKTHSNKRNVTIHARTSIIKKFKEESMKQ